jgi:hypothetical protein
VGGRFVTKKKNGPAKRKQQRLPVDLGFMIVAEIREYWFAALWPSQTNPTWEAFDHFERALVTNLWHRPGKALHGSIALYSALLERNGLDTEPAIYETMDFFGVKRSTVFSARKYVLPVINRVLAHMDTTAVRKTLQSFDQLRQSNKDDTRLRKSMRTLSQRCKSK